MGKHRQPITIKVPRDFQLATQAKHPAEKAPYWEIYKVYPGSRIEGYIMYDRLYSRNWHRVGDRTVPCLLEQGVDCLYHGAGAPRIDYQATVPFITDQSNTIKLVNLTMAAVRDCHGLAMREDLFCCKFTVWRMPGGIRQKMCCRVTAGPATSVSPKMKVTHEEVTRVLEGLYGYKLEREAPPLETVVSELPFDQLGN